MVDCNVVDIVYFFHLYLLCPFYDELPFALISISHLPTALILLSLVATQRHNEIMHPGGVDH